MISGVFLKFNMNKNDLIRKRKDLINQINYDKKKIARQEIELGKIDLQLFDEIDLKSGLLINVCSYCGAYNNITFDRCQACGCTTRLGDKQF